MTSSDQQPGRDNRMFQEPERAARGVPKAAVAIAGAVVLLLLALLLLLGRRHGASPAGAGAEAAGTSNAAYGQQLAVSDVQMSESTNFAGGKETFVDGRIANRGSATVVGATAEVTFPADGVDPQVETVPVTLIRTRQPYIDTEAVSAEPLPPGTSREFRLTFDDVRPDWNQQVPVIRITGVRLR